MKTIAFVIALTCALLLAISPAKAQGVAVSITVAPPAIPVYTQPACPADGYMWSPGYWAWSNAIGDYYWVPGVWVLVPQPGYLWTPGYWGFNGGYYGWHAGYWGTTVGFYGGVNYGCGYGGSGFYGGRWQGGHFQYNTAVVNVNTTVIHNTYVHNVSVSRSGGGASFNGKGGLTAQPNATERAAMNEKHIQATSEQQSHQQAAAQARPPKHQGPQMLPRRILRPQRSTPAHRPRNNILNRSIMQRSRNTPQPNHNTQPTSCSTPTPHRCSAATLLPSNTMQPLPYNIATRHLNNAVIRRQHSIVTLRHNNMRRRPAPPRSNMPPHHNPTPHRPSTTRNAGSILQRQVVL